MKSTFVTAMIALGSAPIVGHATSFNSLDNFHDQNGQGPDLVAHGGNYSFGTHQGLNLD